MKKHIFTKAVLVLLALAMLIIPTGCASKMTDEEARLILADLIPKSQKMNEIVWGEGLPTYEDVLLNSDTVDADQYAKVTDEAEFHSIEEIRNELKKVFSSEYLETVYAVAFGEYDEKEMKKKDIETTEDDYYDADKLGLNTIYPRYKENKVGDFYKNVSSTVYELNTEIYTDTAVVTKRAHGLIVCTVKCKTNDIESDMTVTLREEDGVWLIDSPTY